MRIVRCTDRLSQMGLVFSAAGLAYAAFYPSGAEIRQPPPL